LTVKISVLFVKQFSNLIFSLYILFCSLIMMDVLLFICPFEKNVTMFEIEPHCLKCLGIIALDLSKTVQIKLVLQKSYLLDHFMTNVCGYNILPKFVNQLIASSLQII